MRGDKVELSLEGQTFVEASRLAGCMNLDGVFQACNCLEKVSVYTNVGLHDKECPEFLQMVHYHHR